MAHTPSVTSSARPHVQTAEAPTSSAAAQAATQTGGTAPLSSRARRYAMRHGEVHGPLTSFRRPRATVPRSPATLPPPSDVESRLRAWVDARNAEPCTADKRRDVMDPDTVSLSVMEMRQLAEMIQTQGLMHVTHGSKPMFQFGPRHARNFEGVTQRYQLDARFAFVQGGHAYLVSKENLGALVERHGTQLLEWIGAHLQQICSEPNPFMAGRARELEAQRQALPRSADAVVNWVLELLRDDAYIDDRVIGLLLGYGVQNADGFQQRRSREDLSRAGAEVARLADDHEAWPGFPAPPSFLAWKDADGTGEPETAALLTRYVNESLDMSQTVLAPAYASRDAFVEKAPRLFVASVFSASAESGGAG
jgi:hypothetical protein